VIVTNLFSHQICLQKKIIFTEEYFLSDPELLDKTPAKYKSHKEIYEDAIRKACLILKKVQELHNMGKGDMDVFT
jgi:acyl-CoA oxidase